MAIGKGYSTNISLISVIKWSMDSLTHPLGIILTKNILTAKPLELGTWNFDTMFTICDKVVELVDGGSMEGLLLC